jgi:hypothetical protein
MQSSENYLCNFVNEDTAKHASLLFGRKLESFPVVGIPARNLLSRNRTIVFFLSPGRHSPVRWPPRDQLGICREMLGD